MGGKQAAKRVMTKKEVPKTSVLKKRKAKRKETYSQFLRMVLKEMHRDMKISPSALNVVNSFVHHMFEMITSEAAHLVSYNKKATLTSQEIQTAVKLILPGELAKHAVSEGAKAVSRLEESYQK